MEINRREFIKKCTELSIGCFFGMNCMSSLTSDFLRKTDASFIKTNLREAMFYEKMDGGLAKCTLCPCSPIIENCGILKNEELCVCNVRLNRNGKIYVTNYGRPSVLHLDPIEKNPIYHMTPGKINLAMATAGCSLACKCCQNWEISQKRVDEVKSFNMTPREIVKKALENKCYGITYTYTEPIMYYEYMLEISKIALESGLKTCMVSGGYVLPDPLKLIAQYINGFSISVKGFTEEVYKEYCRGKLSTILNALKTLSLINAWLEIVVLIIPTVSDDFSQIDWFCKWVKDNLGKEVPLHFSRFWPNFKLKSLPKTPISTLEKAAQIARQRGIQYIYLGNVPGHEGENTFCHKCSNLLIQRIGMRMIKSDLRNGKCPKCRTSIPGIWS